MKNTFLTFEELSNSQLYSILKLRQDVFIIEQNCIYPDIDDYDEKAVHQIVTKGDYLVGYSRIFAPNIKYKDASAIGRIIIAPKFRGGEIGTSLIKNSIEFCKNLHPEFNIKIEAQAALNKYYNRLGFQTVSDIYPVDGIDHIEMVYTI